MYAPVARVPIKDPIAMGHPSSHSHWDVVPGMFRYFPVGSMLSDPICQTPLGSGYPIPLNRLGLTRSHSELTDKTLDDTVNMACDFRNRNDRPSRERIDLLQELEQPRRYRRTSNRLTAALVDAHRAYPKHGYGGKRDLGRVNPLRLKTSKYSVIRLRLSKPRPSRLQHQRKSQSPTNSTRMRLSSIFTVYMEKVPFSEHIIQRCVDDVPRLAPESGRTFPTISPSTLQLPNMLHSEQQSPGADVQEAKETASFQCLEQIELERLKELANQQSDLIAPESLKRLSLRGYGLQDLVAWKWILTAPTANDAATRLERIMISSPYMTQFGPVPLFVYLRLLRREDISRRAFDILMQQPWRLLGTSNQKWTGSSTMPASLAQGPRQLPKYELDTLILMVARLARHARQVCPQSCVELAALWTIYAGVNLVAQDGQLSTQATARLTFCYNRILSILALPARQRPFQSVRHRQTAQFMIIRQMNNFKPPLTIDSEGYRAVTRVQLAHRKTHSERRWATLKAKSWPPWKEEKLGVDAAFGVEDGMSRASAVLRRMAEAGYGSVGWKSAAEVLAGWDVDRSPTVQTRSIFTPNAPQQDGRTRRWNTRSGFLKSQASFLWLVRIKATRTLQEAWTCFLACKDHGIPLTAQIYRSMFEKVIYDNKREQESQHPRTSPKHESEAEATLTPGDGKEVDASSVSHNEAVYTREPLPTFTTLFHQMVSDQIKPGGRFLESLLKHASSYAEGVMILETSNLEPAVKDSMIFRDANSTISGSTHANQLKDLPPWLFAAYIDFLCHFACTANANSKNPKWSKHLYRHAKKLVEQRMPYYSPPWNSILALLARPESIVTTQLQYRYRTQAMFKYERACNLLHSMDSVNLELDWQGFGELCKVVQNAAVVARQTIAASIYEEMRVARSSMLESGLAKVKERFSQLVQTGVVVRRCAPRDLSSRDVQTTEASSSARTRPQLQPRLLEIPHPAHLHTYVRFLGQYKDYDGLLDLVTWISKYYDQIMDEAREFHNGERAMRTCLVAIRVYVEQPLGDWAADYDASQVTHPRVEKDPDGDYQNALQRVDTVKAVFESNGDAGGWAWPSDEEFETYIAVGEENTNSR